MDIPVYQYHTNPKWRKLLKIVNDSHTGISTRMVFQKQDMQLTHKQVYGYLRRMDEAYMISGKNGIWRPILKFKD